MKKLLLLGVGSALMFTMGGVGPAAADNGPHVSTQVAAGETALITNAGGGRCATCHRAHTAKAEFLLKAAQPALCYTCHSGSGASTNVVDGVGVYGADAGVALRGGGFYNAKIDGAGAEKTMGTVPGAHGLPIASEKVPTLTGSAAVTSRHQVDGNTAGTIWGNGAISAAVNPGKAGVTLECGSCHDPHGNGNYRILKPLPVDAGTPVQTVITPAVTTWTDTANVVHNLPYNDTTVTPNVLHSVVPAELSAPATGVNIPDATTKVYTTTNYWNVTDRNVPNVKGVALGTTETDGYITNVSQWCSTCHTRYLAGASSYQINSGDALFTYRHRSNRIDKAGVSRPNCIQCHVSHGSNVSMAGDAAAASLPGGATLSPGEAGYGDSKLLRVNNRGTCVMCHNV